MNGFHFPHTKVSDITCQEALLNSISLEEGQGKAIFGNWAHTETPK